MLPLVQKLRNAGWRKRSIQFLEYLGEYKILPSFSLPQSRQKPTNVIMDGRQITMKRNNQTKQKKKQNQKTPAPMGTSNGP